ncbi:conserved hypothetical protein [gamma proteobacterium NOR5-3]|nr:conserved hypothetical protein [gamma proteobacterium NOR5-3]
MVTVQPAQEYLARPAVKAAAGLRCLCLAALLLAPLAQAQSVTVDKVRVGTGATQSRVVLDLTDSVDYDFFRLSDPERLVVDIKNAMMQPTALPSLPLSDPIVRLRHAPRGDGNLRVVVDLQVKGLGARHFLLPPDADGNAGYRLVIDVLPVAMAREDSREASEVEASAATAVEAANASTTDAKTDAQNLVVTDAAAPTTSSSRSAPSSAKPIMPRSRDPQSGVKVDFSGTWEHEWAWGTEASESQKFESIAQPRWDIRFANGVDVTAILRARIDGVGDLGPNDRRPPNYSDVTAPWFNSSESELSLRELFVDFSWGSADWRLGKQQVVWGQADGIKVLDVVNPQSFREFILDDFDNSRIPLWMANVTVPVGDASSLQLLWIPDTTYHELADLDATYGFTSPRIIPQVPITALREPDKPDDPLSDGDAGFAFTSFAGGWDLSLNYLYRYLDAPVLPVRVRGPTTLALEPEYRRSHLVGGSFSNAFGDVTLRGELAYNSDTLQPTNTLVNEAVAETAEFSTLIGLDWALSMDALISAQILNSYLFDHSDVMARDESEQTLTLLYQQDFANAAWRFRGIGIHSLNDGDSQLQLKLSYWWSSELQLWIGADTFSGNNRGLFGQFDENDRVLLGLEYGF